MSTKLSLREALALRGATKAISRERSASGAVKVSLVPDRISQPVEVARLLTRYGLSLRGAHDAIDRLARGEHVAVELHTADTDRLGSDFADLSVEIHVIEAPRNEGQQQ
jgi:hypothetical protein